MRKVNSASTKEISPEKLADLKENALGILSEVRRTVLDRFPFVGGISMQMNLVPTRDLRNPTAATDGNNVYFDIEFLRTLSNEERMFVLAHEIWHNALAHFLRQDGRDRELWNLATDMEVNSLLVEDGMQAPKSALFPSTYAFDDGKSAEEYYELLMQNKSWNSQFRSSSNSSSSQSKGGGSSASSNSADEEQSQNDQKTIPSGNKNGALDKQFDKHIYADDPLEDISSQAPAEDTWGKVGEDPDFLPQVSPNAIEKVREAAISAAQQIERQRGSLPGHLQRIVKNLLTPEIPWSELLCSFVSRCSGDKTSWTRPNRRFVASGTYLPTHYGEKLKIAVGIDTSGSTSSYIKKFLSEVNGILKAYTNYELTVIQCDCDVKSCEFYDENNPLDLEYQEFTINGYGGTRLKPIFDHIELNQIDLDALVIFTDGETEKFTADMMPEYPVMWVLTSNRHDDNFEFGEKCHFKSNS